MEYQPASLNEAQAVDEVVAASTAFGTQTLSELSQGENLVISPAALTVALAMLAEGAGGPAQQQLDELLGASGAERSAAFSALQAAVGEYDGDPAVVQEDELPETPVLHLANQLVLDGSADPDTAFLDALAQHYDAGVVTTDFSAEVSKELLDDWVYEHTGGLIEESAVNAPDPELVFVLQNAILMAAQWESQFDPMSTREQDFTTAGGSVVQTEMMRQTLTADYTEYDGAQVIRLPYAEGFAMDVVLPASGRAAEEFSADAWAVVDEAFAAGETELVRLTMPKLDIATSEDLVSMLTDLGYGDVMAGNDLSAIDPAVFIGQVAHQAVLTVDEKGTVAAAVTEIAGTTSLPVEESEPVEMTVDRPYALRIVHTETSWPLFMAAIYDPTQQ
ncbi:serpin family protein [Nesterenkonia ebinurensis]|uniref:serpin family protein n=1 Tax=Nesterenkonia ebinurensis TaxID=2608252 RepID=UPI00168AC41D|nr:serpin family protein [Nesterenkonia ebinurensis]